MLAWLDHGEIYLFLEYSSEIAVTSAPVSILNWTGFLFNSNSTIHWLSLLCVDIISIVPRKGSSLTVSVHIVTKFVTDLHTDDGGLAFYTYGM